MYFSFFFSFFLYFDLELHLTLIPVAEVDLPADLRSLS